MSEMSLEELPGVGPATAEKLKEAGFNTIEAVAVASPAELANTAEIGEATAAKIINAARQAADIGGFETGDIVLERRKMVGKLTTGCTEFDEIMGGGIETQAITELYGEFGSGKTQLAHQLAVNVQMDREHGGLGGSVIIIDTENTFRPERVEMMAKGVGLDPQEVLKNIYVARAYNSDHQLLLVEKAKELLKDKNVKLLIIDSLTSLFRSDYSGRGELAPRQQKLNRHLHNIQKISEVSNLAVYITNQVMSNPGQLFGDPTTPAGGHVLAHAATYRLYMRRSREDKRVAKLIDSPSMPDAEVIFRVTDEGIRD